MNLDGTLLLAQYQIDNPTATNVLIRIATVVQHIVVVASGILESVGKNRHRAEVSRFVHLPRQ
jgi:hypothetical protein